MKFYSHIVIVLFLCTVLMNILSKESCDLEFKDISTVDISPGTAYNANRCNISGMLIVFANKPPKIDYEISNFELSHAYLNRSITRCFNDNYFVNNFNNLYKVHFSINVIYKLIS